MSNTDSAQNTVRKKPISSVLKSVSLGVFLTVFVVIAVSTLALITYFYFRAERIGTDIGTSFGKAAGKLKGSFEGITEGLAEGAQEGRSAGLSAVDTTVDIGNQIQMIGNLEVLSASVVMHDYMKLGADYETLLAFYGDITFTIDLFEAEIKPDGKVYEVTLPLPKSTLRIDDEKSEQLASHSLFNWSGNTKDAYEAGLNSIKNLTLQAEKTVSNYEALKESAIESAKKQITFLIQSATKEEVVIHVSFNESKNEEKAD